MRSLPMPFSIRRACASGLPERLTLKRCSLSVYRWLSWKPVMILTLLTSAQLLHCLAQDTLDMVLTGEKGVGHANNIQYRWICREPLLIALPATHCASLAIATTR